MNFSIPRFGAAANTPAFKISGAQERPADKVKERQNDNKKGKRDDTAVVMSISGASLKDRSKAITQRYQSMKDTIQKQIDSLNEKLKKASEQGNTELEKQLTESVKELTSDLSALDEQLGAALFREQQRKAEEENESKEEAAKEREKQRDKYKTDEEKQRESEKKGFEFLAKSDIAKDSIQNNRVQKAVLERSKGRLEGEMAADSAAKADREQRQKARLSEIENGFSTVPYVSDKTILTEKKRIANGAFTADEEADVNELNELSEGIDKLESRIGGTLRELNEAAAERAENLKANTAQAPDEDEQSAGAEQRAKRREQNKATDKETNVQDERSYTDI